MHLRPLLRIIGLAILGSALAGGVLIVIAIALVTCYDYPFATRDHPPSVPKVPLQTDSQIEELTFPLPIADDPAVQTDQLIFKTDRSVEQIFAFYQQQLVTAGWEADYTINRQTSQMFILNKQACPYYGLGITIRALGEKQMQVPLDPYVKDRCDCN